MRVLRDAWATTRRRDVLRGRLFGRIDLVTSINAVFVASRGFRSVQACLNKVLALGFGDKRLELGGCECVNKASLGDDEQ
jgi:hypothetical protein